MDAASSTNVRVLDYHEHAMGAGANAQAVAYLELRIDEQHTMFGVGIDANIVSASLKAIVSGLQRGHNRVTPSAAQVVENAPPASASAMQ